MTSYQYLIVGGGMTADAAAKAIRAADATGSIGIIASEPHPPYARPPLSKSLWKGESEDTVWKHTETANVDLQLGRRVRRHRLETHRDRQRRSAARPPSHGDRSRQEDRDR